MIKSRSACRALGTIWEMRGCDTRYAPSTESSISYTGHVLAKPSTHDQTCGFKHFRHTCYHVFVWSKAPSSKPSSDVPGPPFGPRYLKTITVFSPFLIDPLSTACTNSFSESNARAFPVNPRPSLPVIFAIAPPGARLPVSTLPHSFRSKVIDIKQLVRRT
jgi:hypothetical protein